MKHTLEIGLVLKCGFFIGLLEQHSAVAFKMQHSSALRGAAMNTSLVQEDSSRSLLSKRADSEEDSEEDSEDNSGSDHCKMYGGKYQWFGKIQEKCVDSFGAGSVWLSKKFHHKDASSQKYCKTGLKKCSNSYAIECCTRPEGTTTLDTYCAVLGANSQSEDNACKVAPVTTGIKEDLGCFSKVADCLSSPTCSQDTCFKTTTTTTAATTTASIAAAPAPAGTIAGAVSKDAGVVDGKLVTSGSIFGDDVDTDGSSFKGGVVFTSTTAGNGAQLGTLVFNTDGTYSYSVDNSKIQYLKPGESITETYTVTADDGSTTTIKITINGGAALAPAAAPGMAPAAAPAVASAPVGLMAPAPAGVLAAGAPAQDVAGAVSTDAGLVDGNLVTSGSVFGDDVDTGGRIFKGGVVFTSTTAGNGAQLGALVFNTDGTYSYSVDWSKVEYLKPGESITETYTVTADDGSTTTIKITINGGAAFALAFAPAAAPGMAAAAAPAAALLGPPAPTKAEQCDIFNKLLQELFSRIDELKALQTVEKLDEDLNMQVSNMLAVGAKLEGFKSKAMCSDTVDVMTDAEAEAAVDAGANAGSAARGAGDASAAPRDVVAVDAKDLGSFLLVAKDMDNAVEDTETKVVPYDMKWWRYRWEYTLLEMAALIPILFGITVLEGVYWWGSTGTDGKSIVDNYDLDEMPHAMAPHYLIAAVIMFIIWCLSRFPDPESSPFQKMADLNNFYHIVNPDDGYIRSHAPFLGLSWYATLHDILMHGIAALGVWTLIVWVIILRFKVAYTKYHKQEALADEALTTEMTSPAQRGSTRLEVKDTAGFTIGDIIQIGPNYDTEYTIDSFGSIVLETPLVESHPRGSIIRKLQAPKTARPAVQVAGAAVSAALTASSLEDAQYNRQEATLLQLIGVYFQVMDPKSMEPDDRQHYRHSLAHLKKAKKYLSELNLDVKKLNEIDDVEARTFNMDRYYYHVFRHLAARLAIPQLHTVLIIVLAALMAWFLAYYYHMPFFMMLPPIAINTLIAFFIVSGITTKMRYHSHVIMEFMGDTQKTKQQKLDFARLHIKAHTPWVTPYRLAVFLQVPTFTLCYSCTRTILSADLYHHFYGWWCNAVFVFALTILLVIFLGSKFVQLAAETMAQPPYITPENLAEYLRMLVLEEENDEGKKDVKAKQRKLKKAQGKP